MKQCYILLLFITSAVVASAQNSVNKALQFDGVDDYVAIYNGTSMPTNTFTFEAWVKLSAGANDGLVYANYWPFRITVGQSSIECGLGEAGDLFISTANNANQWIYIAFVRSGTSLKGYRNGVLAGTGTVIDENVDFGGAAIGAEPLDGGGSQGNFKGAIDEVRISKIARPASEIQSNWNNGLGKILSVDANTNALWHFNEGPGTYVYDLTQYTHEGKLRPAYPSNSATWVNGFSFPTPTEDMGVFVPDIATRLGIRPLVLISGAASTDNFKAMLDGAVVYQQAGGLPFKLRFPVNLRTLSQGDHTLTFQLLDQGNNLLKSITKTYNKPISGIPHVGIDEDNAFCVDGVRNPFFFGPFLANKEWVEDPAEGWLTYQPFAMTGLIGRSYDEFGNQYDAGEYTDWGWSHGLYGIQPIDGYDDIPGNVSNLKNRSGLLMYDWWDEPDLFGFSPDTVKAWTLRTRALDQQHPVLTKLAGFEAETESLFWNDNCRQYFSPNYVTDAYMYDYYPNYETGKNNENISLEQAFANLATVCDNFRTWSYDQVPVWAFVQTDQLDANSPPPPTPKQLNLTYWINVIHGVRGIGWFTFFWQPRHRILSKCQRSLIKPRG